MLTFSTNILTYQIFKLLIYQQAVVSFTQEGDTMSPRPKMHDYTWLSIHISGGMKEALTRVAAEDERPVSTMARLLIKEALQARGLKWDERP